MVRFGIETASCGLCNQSGTKNATNIESQNAAAYCETCQEFVCHNCLKSHRRLVVIANHKVVHRDHVILPGFCDTRAPGRSGDVGLHAAKTVGDSLSEESARTGHVKYSDDSFKTKEESTNDSDGKVDGALEGNKNKSESVNEDGHNFTEACSKHCTEPIKFFCEFHKQLCCEVCKIYEHKTCLSKIKFIPETAETFINNNMHLLSATIEYALREFKEYDMKLQNDLKELKKSKDTFLYDLKNKKKEITNWLNQMEVASIKKVGDEYDRGKRDIKLKRRNVKIMRHELSSELYCLQEILQNSDLDNIYKFIKMRQAEKYCETAVASKESRQSTNTRFRLKIPDAFDCVRSETEELYQLQFERYGENKFNVRLKEDERISNITGCTFMLNDDIALADRGNACVKLFTSRNVRLVSKVEIPNGVFDVTSVDITTLAVTCPEKGVIEVVDVQRKPGPVITKEVKVGGASCWGLNYHRGQFVVNCSAQDGFCIRVVDFDSVIVFQVKIHACFFSELSDYGVNNNLTICTCPMYDDLADKTLQFTEERKQTGNEEFLVIEYNFLNHLRTQGVTSDRHSNLVVCCKDTHQIYTISRIGTEVELMLAEADGINAPQGICYTTDKSRLLVVSENTDFIQIFEFDSKRA